MWEDVQNRLKHRSGVCTSGVSAVVGQVDLGGPFSLAARILQFGGIITLLYSRLLKRSTHTVHSSP